MKQKTGTKEWADKNINLFKGKCKNGCIYCYAHSNIARFKQCEDWQVNEVILNKSFKKRDYLTMYPSAHDIRMEDIEYHLTFLNNFLKSGSNILIVSKPSEEVVRRLCAQLINYKDQIEFRFTIGSTDDDNLNFFEPDAPNHIDRWFALKRAHEFGYKTSLSIEPMLDELPYAIFRMCIPYVTGDVWIGKINNLKARLKLNGQENIDEAMALTDWQNDDIKIMEIVKEFENSSYKDRVKWKDSIKTVIERNSRLDIRNQCYEKTDECDSNYNLGINCSNSGCRHYV